jgi:putative transposase
MSRTIKKSIKLLPGHEIQYRGDRYVITQIIDLENVLAKNLGTQKSEKILIRDITPEIVTSERDTPNNLELVEDEDWKLALFRFEVIKPILALGQNFRLDAVKQAAEDHSVGKSTIYKWIGLYEVEQRISSLLRPRRKDRGVARVDAKVEEIIKKHIDESYLSEERPTPVQVWELIKADCLLEKLETPHLNTVRNRIAVLSDELKTAKRQGKDAAKYKYEPLKGHFPGADYPLAVVQIDHTPMDIIIVDDEDRQPIGKPFLTIAIDLDSKVIQGYHIGLDPVGALATGLCITHAILPKEAWLAKMNITTPYPVWGKMKVIHTDNAKEFQGTMLELACKEHGITAEKRPKGQPHYGGNVERAFRTFMDRVHTVPGTTRSNVQDKGDYDSEGNACMTLGALEQWFAIFVVEVYHQKSHKGNNNIPPIAKYERGILGDDKQPGIGLQDRIADEYKFKLDFMPFEMRTVQEYGILFNDINYYHDGIRHWIHAIDPNDRKRKRKFVCRYDPRDLSKLYFYDPETMSYIEVPYRDITKPPISIWELREAKKRLKEQGIDIQNEEVIFAAIRKMNELVKAEKVKTKATRKKQARQKQWGKAKQHTAKPADEVANNSVLGDVASDIFSGVILPFDDIQEEL